MCAEPANRPAELPEDTQTAPECACFVDRELSWLQFNLRVLMEAGDRSVLLLERLKYLAIYQNNLDEFFMVRVGSLMHRSILFSEYIDPKTDWTPAEELKRVLSAVRAQQDKVAEVYRRLVRDLRAGGIELLDARHVSKADEIVTRKIFAEVRQLLSPRIVDAEHPMPFLDNRELYLAVQLKKNGKQKLGLLDISRLPAYRVFEADGIQKVIPMEELVLYYVPQLFKRYDARGSCVIRVTRNADVLMEDSSIRYDQDFRVSMEKLLRKRQRQEIVRLEIYGCQDKLLEEKLIRCLRVPHRRVFTPSVPLRNTFAGLLTAEPGMKFPEQHSVRTVELKKGGVFSLSRAARPAHQLPVPEHYAVHRDALRGGRRPGGRLDPHHAVSAGGEQQARCGAGLCGRSR